MLASYIKNNISIKVSLPFSRILSGCTVSRHICAKRPRRLRRFLHRLPVYGALAPAAARTGSSFAAPKRTRTGCRASVSLCRRSVPQEGHIIFSILSRCVFMPCSGISKMQESPPARKFSVPEGLSPSEGGCFRAGCAIFQESAPTRRFSQEIYAVLLII